MRPTSRKRRMRQTCPMRRMHRARESHLFSPSPRYPGERAGERGKVRAGSNVVRSSSIARPSPPTLSPAYGEREKFNPTWSPKEFTMPVLHHTHVIQATDARCTSREDLRDWIRIYLHIDVPE